MVPKFHSVYQLKILLRQAKPPIWRRVQVPEDITLSDLHQVIQLTMGWYNEHLYQFYANDVYYGEFDDLDVEDATKARLKDIAREKSRFTYEYDFGDSWVHQITVEKILPPEPQKAYPRCIGGKRACPPEDIGGIWGYYQFLEALKDLDHPMHEEFTEWYGEDFDPEEFDPKLADQQLERLQEKYS